MRSFVNNIGASRMIASTMKNTHVWSVTGKVSVSLPKSANEKGSEKSGVANMFIFSMEMVSVSVILRRFFVQNTLFRCKVSEKVKD